MTGSLGEALTRGLFRGTVLWATVSWALLINHKFAMLGFGYLSWSA